MKLNAFKLLADENIHHDVVASLRRQGFDVADVSEERLWGTTDVALLRRAVSEGRVVITHDRDFGALAVLGREPIVGIVYLRPGHIAPQFTIEMIDTIVDVAGDLSPPFIIVAQRRRNLVRVRIRRLT